MVVRRLLDRHDAAAVVAAILEPPQSFDQKVDRLLGADVADNATHSVYFLSWPEMRLTAFPTFYPIISTRPLYRPCRRVPTPLPRPTRSIYRGIRPISL